MKKIILVFIVGLFLALVLSCASTSSSTSTKDVASIDDLIGVDNKLVWLKSNAASDTNYVFEVNGNERIAGGDSFFTPVQNTNLSYKGKSNITITIRGIGSDARLSPRTSREFTVGSGVTLILENVTINSPGTTQGMITGTNLNKSLVTVSSGGTFVMNDGSAIVGNDAAGSGGGVFVSDGGTFLMNGGLITGNRAAITKRIMGVAEIAKGGGVFVQYGGTFTKTGGTITGYASDKNSGNVVWVPNDPDQTKATALEPDGNNNCGHAVYAEYTGSRFLGVAVGSASKRQERTAGPDVNLHVGNETFSGDWEF